MSEKSGFSNWEIEEALRARERRKQRIARNMERLKICSAVETAQKRDCDQSTDFDSVAKLLNNDDTQTRVDAAKVLVLIADEHPSLPIEDVFDVDMKRRSIPPYLDTETTTLINNVLLDATRCDIVLELLKLLDLLNWPCDLAQIANAQIKSTSVDVQLASIGILTELVRPDLYPEEGVTRAPFFKPEIYEAVEYAIKLLRKRQPEKVELAILRLFATLSADMAEKWFNELMKFVEKKGNDASRVAAIRVIQGFQEHADVAVPKLVQLSIRTSDVAEVVESATRAIVKLDSDGTVIKDRVDKNHRKMLIESLRKLESDGKQLREILLRAHGDESCQNEVKHGIASDSSDAHLIDAFRKKQFGKQREQILIAMLKLNATESTPKTLKEIKKEAKVASTDKKILNKLRDHKYVERGQRIGFFLTRLGIRTAKALMPAAQDESRFVEKE